MMPVPTIEPASYRFHPSSLAAIMSDPKSMDVSLLSPDEKAIYAKRTKNEDEKALMAECMSRGLSEGAKSYLNEIAKGFLFDYARVVETKELAKGIAVEDAVIQLYNHVNFTSYKKNTKRKVNDYLSGECDIFDERGRRKTLDAKAAWSLDTFPLLPEDMHSSTYEWQGRGYMLLWDAEEHEVFYGLVDTPDEILTRYGRGEQIDAHKVEHIDPKLRITRVVYQRDRALERKIEIKCRMGQQYLAQVVARIRSEHGVIPNWKQKILNNRGN